ncbi:hypothetical protein KL935_000804 [Ogataea polymorpha]|uniref:Aminotransferase class I/classII large domain-containing protein n=2 Tax=Ogataea polymorpha TaxID=460523 RepID=A0A9P8PER3_9ASCO|nr:hypothetical protein KL935_000804 [Ogataea polymorpha]KAG7938221.1 hypothetical protein KL934_000795 [Ogataea polymorpha]KAH3669942.1 hypothetical protein OGATHE_002755 [Ogataea polymorpha]
MSHQAPAKYNFFKGHPSVDLLPNKEIIEASKNVLSRFDNSMDNYDGVNDTHPLNYGTDPGNLEVRTLIADWNDNKFELETKTDPDCLNLTSGSSYGIMNILAQFSSAHNGVTRRAFLVSPTYFLMNAIFIDAGFGGKMTSIEEDETGQIDFETLRQRLELYDTLEPVARSISEKDIAHIHDPDRPLKKIYRYIMYIVPTFSNPRGGTLSQENRQRLIELARKHDMLIICDDVYELLDFHNKVPHKRMVYLDRETLPEGEEYGNVISNTTFSKILGPGLRTGYQESATPKLAYLLSQGGATRSGGTPSQLNTVIVGELYRMGAIDNILARLNSTYSKRAAALNEALQKYLPKGTQISPINGGYFNWVVLPENIDAQEVANKCRKRGVVLATGDNFEVTGDPRGWGKRSVRMSISHLDADQIEEGVRIWGEECA